MRLRSLTPRPERQNARQCGWVWLRGELIAMLFPLSVIGWLLLSVPICLCLIVHKCQTARGHLRDPDPLPARIKQSLLPDSWLVNTILIARCFWTYIDLCDYWRSHLKACFSIIVDSICTFFCRISRRADGLSNQEGAVQERAAETNCWTADKQDEVSICLLN